jgi:hypothetical protein
MKSEKKSSNSKYMGFNLSSDYYALSMQLVRSAVAIRLDKSEVCARLSRIFPRYSSL